MVTEQERIERARYMAELREDAADVKADYMAQTRGNRTQFIEARMLPLPGMRLAQLAKAGMLDWDGCTGYRPKR